MIVKIRTRLAFSISPIKALMAIAGQDSNIAMLAGAFLIGEDLRLLQISPEYSEQPEDVYDIIQCNIDKWDEMGFLATFGFSLFESKLSERIFRTAYLRMNPKIADLFDTHSYEEALARSLSLIERSLQSRIPFDAHLEIYSKNQDLRLKHFMMERIRANPKMWPSALRAALEAEIAAGTSQLTELPTHVKIQAAFDRVRAKLNKEFRPGIV